MASDLTAAILATAAALGGVALQGGLGLVRARRADRREDRLRYQEQKRLAYITFLRTSRHSEARRERDAVELTEADERYQEAMKADTPEAQSEAKAILLSQMRISKRRIKENEQIISAHTTLLLLAPRDLQAAGQEVVRAATEADAEAGSKALSDFIEAARRDLGTK